MPKSSMAKRHAELLELQHPGDDRLGVLDEDALGDLEHQAVRDRGPTPRRALDTSSTRLSCWKCRAEMLTLRRSGMALGKCRCHSRAWRHACRSTQRPSGTMRPVSSASGMNSLREQEPALGVAPADRAPRTRCRVAAVEADDRLVEELELALVDGPLQIGGPLEPLHHGRLQRGLVHLVATLAPGLGRVHGHVGGLDAARPGPRSPDG